MASSANMSAWRFIGITGLGLVFARSAVIWVDQRERSVESVGAIASQMAGIVQLMLNTKP